MIPSHGPLRQVELAEEDGASGLQPGEHRSVKVRHMVRQCPGPSHGTYAFGKAQIFHRYRDPMQETTVCPGTDIPLCHPRRLQSLVRHHGSIALVTPVELSDALEERPRYFHRRELLRLYQGSEFSDSMEIQRCVGHGSVPICHRVL